MKKRHVDHVLRAAGKIAGDDQFIIIGSQSLHGKYPDIPDEFVFSNVVDIIAKNQVDHTEWLNAIGVDSDFHREFGYYADPVDEKTAVLPKGWKGRLINLPPGDTGGVRGLCLDPHDLAIAKYVARREKDVPFTRAMAQRGLVKQTFLLQLLRMTPITETDQRKIAGYIDADFEPPAAGNRKKARP